MVVSYLVFFAFSRRYSAVIVSLAAAFYACQADALEHVTLRNGFALDCSHHVTVGDHVRLFTSSDDSSYQDLPTVQVAAIETMPEPLVTVANASSPRNPEAEPTVAEMRELLLSAGAAHDIDVELLASVIKAESAFHAHAVSRTGARGLMQLMPGTAQQLGVQDAFRADQNIAGGTAYLDSLLRLYKDNLALALAAYNAGPAAVARYHGVPPFRETRAYVARVMTEFARRKRVIAASAAMATP